MRALLVAAAVICGVVGGAQVFKTFAQYIEVDPIQRRGPTTIKGRIVQFFGPPDLEYVLEIDGSLENDQIFSQGITRRTWPCIYPIERFYDFSRLPPGKCQLTLIAGRWDEKGPRGASTTVVVPGRH
ncbi:MAG TPA: hypothetical protein VG125_05930 [Pirellulales bacterium]|nr:hypothetical protein [Pirellulales bacterium]